MLKTRKQVYALTATDLSKDRWSILLLRRIGYKFELAEIVYDGIGKNTALQIFEELISKETS